MKLLCVISIFLLCLPTFAQDGKSLEQLRKEEELQRALETIDQFDAKLNSMIKRRESECAKAIGYRPFCDCVLKELPVAWSFGDYVWISTRTKEENGYAKMDKDFRAAYDKVAPIRDKCVKAINAKP